MQSIYFDGIKTSPEIFSFHGATILVKLKEKEIAQINFRTIQIPRWMNTNNLGRH